MGDDTVEIYTLWNRLKQRFSITRSQPKSFILGDTVIPVTNVDNPLDITKMLTLTTTVSSNGYKTLGTVPTGKRWDVYSFDIWKVSGTYDVVGIYLKDGSKAAHVHKFVAAAKYCWYAPTPVPMNETWNIQLEVENYAASGSLYLMILYKERDMEE